MLPGPWERLLDLLAYYIDMNTWFWLHLHGFIGHMKYIHVKASPVCDDKLEYRKMHMHLDWELVQ